MIVNLIVSSVLLAICVALVGIGTYYFVGFACDLPSSIKYIYKKVNHVIAK
jgi:hypothetical protein